MRILVSGASRGIGRAICLEALKRGSQVHALVRKKEDAPPGCVPHVADVRDREAMRKILKELAPEIDCFIANAGIGESLNPRKPESADKAAEVLDVNTTSVVFSSYVLAHEWIQLGARNKKIGFVSSLGAGRGFPRSAVYIASKTAIVSFAQGFERDLSKHGIGVSVILPGFIDTDMTKELSQRPFLMTAEEAAKVIHDGLDRGSFWISFPRSMAVFAWLRDRIPYFMFRWTVTQLQKKKVF